MPGMTRDSHQFLESAAASGAVAAVVYNSAGLMEAQRLGMSAVLLNETSFESEVGKLANAFYDYPSRSMKIVGVTGTNGKTTTAWLIRDMLTALGYQAGYLGTLGFQIPGESRELSNTTPFSVELIGLLAEARDQGVEALAIEVSSHALAQHRADGVEFDVSVFTNLTQDHLDFHQSMEAYEQAKYRLFSEIPRLSSKHWQGAINVDDATGKRWSSSVPSLPFSASNTSGADLLGQPLHVSIDEIEIELTFQRSEPVIARAPLGGSYNIENLLSATAGILALTNRTIADVATTWPAVRPVP